MPHTGPGRPGAAAQGARPEEEEPNISRTLLLLSSDLGPWAAAPGRPGPVWGMGQAYLNIYIYIYIYIYINIYIAY